jgi:hypothetical protein
MTMQKRKIPALLIERAAQGELDGTEVAQLRERLAAEGRSLDSELAALRQSDRQILAELPRQRMGEAIRRRAAQASPTRPPFRLTLLLAPTVLAGAVALALLMVRGPGNATPTVRNPSQEEVIGIKGEMLRSPRLVVYRRKAAQASGVPGSERLSDGVRVARGDLLQLAYDKAPDGLYGVMLSIDGAGRVTQHLPEEGARASARLTAIREVPLPSAYELDDAPGFERFVLITSSQPFPVGVALEAAHAVASQGASAQSVPLPLGVDYHQTSMLVRKTGKGSP